MCSHFSDRSHGSSLSEQCIHSSDKFRLTQVVLGPQPTFPAMLRGGDGLCAETRRSALAKTAHPTAHPQACFWYLKRSLMREYSLYNQELTELGLATNQKVGSSTLSGRTTQTTIF